jgi:hypothetical protein
VTDRRTLGLAVLAAALIAPAGAGASTAAVAGGTLAITAGAGETNMISVTTADFGFGPTWAYEDLAGITAGDGCTQRTPTVVTCSGYGRVEAMLGDGDDTYSTNESIPDVVDGGPGNDTINGGAGNDRLLGGDGNDTLDGDSENDELDGQAGNDNLTGDDGDDIIRGGTGSDSIRGDGPTAFGNGNDVIDASDGEADQVDCGFGADTATVDTIDAVVECETVTQSGGGDGGGGALSAKLTAPKRLTVSRFLAKGYRGTITISQPGELRLGLVVSKAEAKRTGLGTKALLIASEVETAPEAGTFAFTLKAKRSLKAKLAKLTKLKVTAALLLTNAAGQEKLVQRPLTLRKS